MPPTTRKKQQGKERKAKSTGNCQGDCECSSKPTSTATGSSKKTPVYKLNEESIFYKKYEQTKVNDTNHSCLLCMIYTYLYFLNLYLFYVLA